MKCMAAFSVDVSVAEKLNQISKKSGIPKSRIVNQLLRDLDLDDFRHHKFALDNLESRATIKE